MEIFFPYLFFLSSQIQEEAPVFYFYCLQWNWRLTWHSSQWSDVQFKIKTQNLGVYMKTSVQIHVDPHTSGGEGTQVAVPPEEAQRCVSWLGTETCCGLHAALEPSDLPNVHRLKLSMHRRMVVCSSLRQADLNSGIRTSWAVQVCGATEKTF